jgi:DnaJ domain
VSDLPEVLIWARRWARRPDAAEHELLEVSAVATMETVRSAYHKLARFAHPDLHRATVTGSDLEEITETFARVSNAYSVLSARLRQQAQKKAASPPVDAAADLGSRGAAAGPAASRPGRAPPSAGTEKVASFTAPTSRMTSAPPPAPGAVARPASTLGPSSSTGPATGLSSKAMLHYRRAELCLRRGELVEARLHLKLALATDPQSAFLRKALEELERR